jgi:hypothetical protein
LLFHLKNSTRAVIILVAVQKTYPSYSLARTSAQDNPATASRLLIPEMREENLLKKIQKIVFRESDHRCMVQYSFSSPDKRIGTVLFPSFSAKIERSKSLTATFFLFFPKSRILCEKLSGAL